MSFLKSLMCEILYVKMLFSPIGNYHFQLNFQYHFLCNVDLELDYGQKVTEVLCLKMWFAL